jgi:hypothetical protein
MEAVPTISRVVEGNGKLEFGRIRRANGLGFTAILINFLNGMIGPGTLSLPLVFKQAGLWVGLKLLPFPI